MKVLILAVNLFLVSLLAWETIQFFDGTPELATRTTRTKKKSAGVSRTAAVKKTAMSGDEAARIIQQKNIFNITRCPDAIGGRGGSSTMALLGIYRIGDRCGAIIQNSSSRGRSSYNGPPWMRQRVQARQQIRTQQTFMQGDVMDNGYIVSEIYEDRVVLTRGGGRLELRLELASRPIARAAAARAARASRPTAQQMQQRMMGQQMMIMRQLMQSNNAMQQQMRNMGGSNTRSSRRR